MPEFYTVNEFAALKTMHRRSVMKAIGSNRIQAEKVEGRYRIPAQEAERFSKMESKVRALPKD